MHCLQCVPAQRCRPCFLQSGIIPPFKALYPRIQPTPEPPLLAWTPWASDYDDPLQLPTSCSPFWREPFHPESNPSQRHPYSLDPGRHRLRGPPCLVRIAPLQPVQSQATPNQTNAQATPNSRDPLRDRLMGLPIIFVIAALHSVEALSPRIKPTLEPPLGAWTT